MSVIVPRIVTPISVETAASMLVHELDTGGIFMGKVTRDLATFLLAQIWIETNQGHSLIQNNWGNISASESYPTFWRPPWFDQAEIDKEPNPDKKARYQELHLCMQTGRGSDGKPCGAPRAFRAYPDLLTGLKDYVAQLGHHFPSVLTAAASGNPSEMAHAIKDSRYCPDCDPAKSTPTLASFAQDFGAKELFALLPKVLVGGEPSQGSSPSSPQEAPPGPYLVRAVAKQADAGLFLLELGVKGPLVAVWQKALGMIPTGDFDQETWSRTKSWQKVRGLEDDGEVGRLTWGKYINAA